MSRVAVSHLAPSFPPHASGVLAERQARFSESNLVRDSAAGISTATQARRAWPGCEGL
jgi:hypothetical protein